MVDVLCVVRALYLGRGEIVVKEISAWEFGKWLGRLVCVSVCVGYEWDRRTTCLCTVLLSFLDVDVDILSNCMAVKCGLA